MTDTSALLEVTDLCIDYVTADGWVRAVDGVSFTLHQGELLGLAGESGSGKSTLIHGILRTLGQPGVITGGEVRFLGRDVLAMSAEELRQLRWREIAMVFQSAMNALNPVATLHEQIADTLRAHERGITKVAIRKRAEELLDLVGIDRQRLGAYPHMLSGGMRQRAVIAIALALHPKVVIMDEPTTALDVVVEKQILQRVLELKSSIGFSILFITHDLPLMLSIADRIGILYAGRLAELGPTATLQHQPAHPYTAGLMRVFPSMFGQRQALHGIPGTPPSMVSPPSGCRFHPRCAYAADACRSQPPALSPRGDRHVAACILDALPQEAAPTRR